MEILKKIYALYFTVSQKYMTVENAIELFTVTSDCQLSQKDALFCLGMSKMTNAFENEEHKNYTKLLFVEFLEMIGRAANIKY